jgi:hypothetical protein
MTTPAQRIPAIEAGRMFGLSEDGVYREARLGRLPHVKLGRRVLFFRDVLEAFRTNGGLQDAPAPDPTPKVAA